MQDGGWTLAPAVDADFDEVMTWFPDAESVDIWGGPRFRYPFTAETFREDCRVDLMVSYVLRTADGRLAAFGQSYVREGRGHLDAHAAGRPRHGQQRKIGQINPTRRSGQPEEIGQMACFLLSDRASYVNGQAIPVDGGLSASHPWAFPRQQK